MDDFISPKDMLVALSLRHRGDIRSVLRDIRERTEVSDMEVARAKRLRGAQICCPFDASFPEELKRVPLPPVVLYFRGDIALVRNLAGCVAIVGSREPGEYAIKKTRELATALAKRGFSIVSGLARGIDSVALEAALPYGKAVAIIGNGMDYCYPPENLALQDEIAKRGLLISEYPKATPPCPKNFVVRNRLIAGLAQVVVVAEAKLKSGSLITATFAANMGHDVCAFPHDDDGDNGCNAIIKDGAFLVENEEDIRCILGTKGEPFFGRKNGKTFYK